jgi:hypothetical protein
MTTNEIDRASAPDTLEAFAGGRPAFPVEIPEWVPVIIAGHARATFGHFRRSAGHDAMLVRLTTDPRMRAVWAYLTRRDRKTGLLSQPTRMNVATIADPTERQEQALELLFCLVQEFAGSRPRAMLKREVDEIRADREAMARKLWAEADRLAYLEEWAGGTPGRARILNEAAGVLIRMSREEETGIVVERDRGTLETRAVATAIAGACDWLFGSPFCTLSATMTAVALDCEVMHREVREWWSERPIQPSADKGGYFEALSAVCKPHA